MFMVPHNHGPMVPLSHSNIGMFGPMPRIDNCGHNQLPISMPYRRRRFNRKLLLYGLGSVLLVGLTILIVFLVLRPTSPLFELREVSFIDAGPDPGPNGPAPSLLTRVVQATVATRNPNRQVGVIYDRLNVFATYRDRQFTVTARLPKSHVGPHNGAAEWSPVMQGSPSAVTPDVAAMVNQDAASGKIFVEIKIEGKLRWKVGVWKSNPYRIFVRCPAYVKMCAGGVLAKFEGMQDCGVDISS